MCKNTNTAASCSSMFLNISKMSVKSNNLFCPAESNHAVTPPKVRVLEPSERECKHPKHKESQQYNKTLVCVASDFYPDHVSVSWKINEERVTKGTTTDRAARRTGKSYVITSRLMVPLTLWYSPDTNFSCTVSFFNGTDTVFRSNWVTGTSGMFTDIQHGWHESWLHSLNLLSLLPLSAPRGGQYTLVSFSFWLVFDHEAETCLWQLHFARREICEGLKQHQNILCCFDREEQHLWTLCSTAHVEASGSSST